MKKVYIYQHMGIGDMIACNGLIRTLITKTHNTIFYIFCHDKFFKTIKFMYRDEKKIKLISVNTKKNTDEQVELFLKKLKKNEKVIRIGFDNFDKIYKKLYSKKDPIAYDMIFYNQLKIKYEKRFSNCYWKRDVKEENRVFKKLVKNPKKKYAFVHDEPFLNYKIDRSFIKSNYKIIKNDKKEMIFNLGKVIENASELHLMESSIRNMTEFLRLKAKKKYLYIWRRRKLAPIYNIRKQKIVGTKKNWKIIFQNPNRKKNLIFFLLEIFQKFKFYYL